MNRARNPIAGNLPEIAGLLVATSETQTPDGIR